MEIEKVPEVMSPEALSIYIAMPTVDDPNRRLCLQDAVSALTNGLLDLHAQVAELQRWAQLTDELSSAVRKMQSTFDTLAKQLHGTTVTAKAILGGIRPPKGNVN